jgi:hypothetical protein
MTAEHRRHDGDDAVEWASLTPEALRDEIRANRRAELRLMVLGILAMAITATVLVLRGALV